MGFTSSGDSAHWHENKRIAARVPNANRAQCRRDLSLTVLSKMATKMLADKPTEWSRLDRTKWRRRKCTKPQEEDNDCASLAWLLNFRLDDFVNIKVPDDEPSVAEIRADVTDVAPTTRKPPYTYHELIERALREKGELTVSAIYQWISDRFPFYKANDERWKNSVRHNLSINPHFRKGARAPQGAGHLWSLAANSLDLLPFRGDLVYESTEEPAKEEIQECVIECPKVIVLDEAAIAAASIIPDQSLFSGSTMFLNPVSTEQVVRECGLIPAD